MTQILPVTCVNNPIKVITIEGVLKDEELCIKPFALENGNIQAGTWEIALKNFSYEVKEAPRADFILSVHTNVVTGFHQPNKERPKPTSPEICSILIEGSKIGAKLCTFSNPDFFLMDSINQTLKLHFNYFPSASINQKNINFKATFYYVRRQ
jgi:hypothetical protein